MCRNLDVVLAYSVYQVENKKIVNSPHKLSSAAAEEIFIIEKMQQSPKKKQQRDNWKWIARWNKIQRTHFHKSSQNMASEQKKLDKTNVHRNN